MIGQVGFPRKMLGQFFRDLIAGFVVLKALDDEPEHVQGCFFVTPFPALADTRQEIFEPVPVVAEVAFRDFQFPGDFFDGQQVHCE